jgi:hypothetical protein
LPRSPPLANQRHRPLIAERTVLGARIAPVRGGELDGDSYFSYRSLPTD